MTREVLAAFHRRFRYKADGCNKWTILNLDDAPAVGNCDDFAFTSLFIMAGGSRLKMLWMVATLQACMWYTISGKNGHMMLWVRGHGWTDNIYPQWSLVPRFPKLVPYALPLFLLALVVKPVVCKACSLIAGSK